MHRLLVVAAAGLAALVASGSAAAWSWPADGDMLRPFTLGGDAYAAGQHRGIDVAGSEGSPVRAPAAGSVSFAGTLPTYGRGVTILTSDGYAVTLVHLGSVTVEKGDTVGEGAAIGTMGWSGDAEHAVASVHLGVRIGSQAEGYVDPLDLLPPRPTSPAPSPPVPPATPVAAVSPSPAPAAGLPPTGPEPSAQSSQSGPSGPSPPAAALEPPIAATPQPADGDGAPAVRSEPAAASAGQEMPAPDVAAGADAHPAVSAQAAFRVLRSGAAAAPTTRPVSPSAVGPTRPDAVTPTASRAVRRVEPAPSAVTRGTQPAAVTTTTTTERGRIDAEGAPTPDASVAAARSAEAESAHAVLRKAPPSTAPAPVDRPRLGDVSRRRGSLSPIVSPGPASDPAAAGARTPGRGAVVALVLLAVLVAAAVAKGARRIGGDGAVLRHHADLLRQLHPAHRARVHDGGGGHRRASSAAARP